MINGKHCIMDQSFEWAAEKNKEIIKDMDSDSWDKYQALFLADRELFLSELRNQRADIQRMMADHSKLCTEIELQKMRLNVGAVVISTVVSLAVGIGVNFIRGAI